MTIGESSVIESSDKNKLEDIQSRVKDLNSRLQDIRREQVFQRVRFVLVFILRRAVSLVWGDRYRALRESLADMPNFTGTRGRIP